MSKRPRIEPSTGQDDIWGDDFTNDEVNSIDNIETLASQSNFPGEYIVVENYVEDIVNICV